MASKTERVLTFYRELLNSLDLVVDEEGMIAFAPPGAVDKQGNPVFQEALLDGRRWCLPTPAILDASPWKEYIAFHPLSENFANEESETLTKLKAAINLKLGATVGKILMYLTDFAADAERHGKVPAKAAKFLKLVPNLKSISADRMAEIVEKSTLHADRRFVNVYLKKGGVLAGVTYGYAAMVTFPFRRELEGAEPKVFGVTISKKDQQSFKALFDYILPDSEELSAYSAGSSSHTAPRLEALLKAYLRLTAVLNELVETHKKILPTYQELVINTSWEEEMQHLRALADVIPPLPGNIGEAVKDRKTDQGVQMKPAANRLFGQKETKERRHEPSRPASTGYQPHSEAPAALAAPRVEAAPVTSPVKEDLSKLSFAERQQRAREREQEAARLHSGYGLHRDQPAQTGYRSYQTVDPNIPDWMRQGETNFQVAGDVQGQPGYAQHQRYQPGEPAGSFSDRMSRRNVVGGYGSGQYHSSRFSL
jgi:hypothetical protein